MYSCRGCGRNIGDNENFHGIEIGCGKTNIYFWLCDDCLKKHNEGQLSLEYLRFSFPLKDRCSARNILTEAF
jgi:hypothetical protein